MQNKKIAAVDFGSKKLSISLGIMEKDDIDILGYLAMDSKGIEKGLVKDIEKCNEAFVSLITSFEKKVNEPIEEIYAGISSRNIIIKEITSEVLLEEGRVTANDIKRSIKKGKKLVNISDDEEVIDSIINFYILDGNAVFDNVMGWMGHNLKVNIIYFIAKTKDVETFKHIISNNGYKFKGFVVNIYSGKQVFLNGRNSNDVRVLIDIGAGVSEYAIFKDGVLREIGSIPLGGDNVTNDLAICGKYTKSEAENIKLICSSNYVTLYEGKDDKDVIEVGTSKVSKTLFYEVTKARIEELLKLVNSKLKNSSYYEDICSIILYGDGMTYYENINDMLHNEFEKKTRIITKEYLGMKNSLNITSLAIVKEVSDRLTLLRKDTKTEKEIEYLLNEKKETEEPKVESYSGNGIVDKIKKVLGDIF